MAKRNAFTLAEVLITLGIIGVVAAMTLPSLLTSTQAAQFRAQVKKTLAVTSQAVVVNLAMDDFDIGTTTTTAITRDNDGVPSAALGSIFAYRLQVQNPTGTIGSTQTWTFVNGTTTNADFGATDTNYTFFLNDGSVLSFPKTCQGNDEWNNGCKGVIDVNGRKKPNIAAICDSASATDDNCKITKKAYDIYPVRLYGQTIRPNSVGARYILYKAGK